MADTNGRTTAIWQAVQQQLSTRRLMLDEAADLGQVTITVRLEAGTCRVKGVVWEEERVARRVEAGR